MKTIQGKGVVNGLARGKIIFFQQKTDKVPTYQAVNGQEEWERFVQGRKKAVSELTDLAQKIDSKAEKDSLDILEAHIMMIEDITFEELVKEKIEKNSMNAAQAVLTAANELINVFEGMENQYMKARAIDLKDVSRRIIGRILNPNLSAKKFFEDQSEKIILAAKDLMPSETMQMDKSKILAILTEEGTVNSHTVIIARSLNIPAIISLGKDLDPSLHQKEVIVDGEKGNVYIDPNAEVIASYIEQKSKMEIQRKEYDALIGKQNITLNGQKIDIYANIGSAEEVEAACRYDAGGIGLFRSEFLFLEKTNYPTEEEQFEAYKKVAVAMQGKRVIVRTIDIGADKQADYFNIPYEENPAMGYRAIRICLTEPEIFKVQLRALYRASAFGRIAIMFPMITSIEEVIEIKRIIEEIKEELRKNEILFNEEVELGVMIETPAAVMISDLLADEVDFFSIGTNDLTQYTLAIDRQNPRLDRFYMPHHPAILRMIELVIDHAHQKGKWVGICGEVGGDAKLTEYFLTKKLDEISVSPSKILELRKIVRCSQISE